MEILRPSESVSSDEISEKIHERCQTNNNLIQNKSHGRSNNNFKDSRVSEMLLSRKKIKMNTQKDEIIYLRKTIDSISEENKTIRTQSFRQLKDIDYIQKKDLSVSNIFKQHEAEVFNLKEQVKKIRSSLSCEKKLRNDMEIEVFNLSTTLYKTQGIIDESKLLEKYDIKRQLDKTKESMALKHMELEALKKQLENQDKNYKIEMSTVQKQMRFYNERCEELQSHVEFLKVSLKEKQKLLDIQNIYSNRINLCKISRRNSEMFPGYHLISTSDLSNSKKITNTTSKSLLELPRMNCFDYRNIQNLANIQENKFKQTEIEKKRALMIEDIRKIIIQEIKHSKFAIFNNHLLIESESRTLSPINIRMADILIDSPLLISENVDNDKNNPCKMEKEEYENETKKNQLEIDNKLIISRNGIRNKNNLLKFKIKSNSTVIILPEIKESESQDVYLRPNSCVVVENENWLNDMETITVSDFFNDVKSKSNKKEECEDIYINNENKSNNLIQSVFKLPQPIIDDLKDKKSVIDEKLKMSLLNNVIGNRDSKSQNNLKNSIQKLIFSKHSNKLDISMDQNYNYKRN